MRQSPGKTVWSPVTLPPTPPLATLPEYTTRRPYPRLLRHRASSVLATSDMAAAERARACTCSAPPYWRKLLRMDLM